MMTTKEIKCTCCGLQGDIGGYDQGTNGIQTKTFRHRGHDPFTGQLYYQCPCCLSTLQVDPMDILKGAALKGIPLQKEQYDVSFQSIFLRVFQKLSGLRKVLHHVASTSGK